MIYNKEVKEYYCNKCGILKAKRRKELLGLDPITLEEEEGYVAIVFIVVMQNAENYKQKLLHFNTPCTKTNTKFDGGSLWGIILQQVFNGRNTI